MDDREELAALRRLAELEARAGGGDPYSFKNLAGAAVEPNLSMLSGMATTPIAGLAGIAGTLLPGPEGQGANWARNVSDVGSYSPRTEGGRTATEAISYPFRKLGEGADYLGGKTSELTGSPALGAAVNAGVQVGVPLALSRFLTGSNKQPTIKEDTLSAGRQEGYVVPPSASNGSFLNKRLESIAGKAAIGQEAAARNQAITNEVVAREAGLPPGTQMSEGILKARRLELGKPYNEASLIDKSVAADVEALKQARFDTNNYFKFFQRSGDPSALAKAKELGTKAVELESYIEDAAKNAGKPDLVSDLKKARVEIAKIHEIERALNVGTGDISAPVLGRAVDTGRPLTGGLKTVGRMQQAFPSYMREGATIPTPGVSKSEALAGALLGTGGFAVGGPWGAALGALPLLSGPTRSLLLSKPYQAMLADRLGRTNLGRTALMGAMVNQEQQ